MTLATDMMWEVSPPAKLSLPAITYERAAVLAAVVGAGVAFSMWSMATMATLHTMETSVASASLLLPESAVLPGTVALVDPFHKINRVGRSSVSPFATGGSADRFVPVAHQHKNVAADGRSARYASVVVESSKSGRVGLGRQARLGRLGASAKTPLERRFERVVAEARLTPEKQSAAFAKPTRALAAADRAARVALAQADGIPALPSAAASPASASPSDVPLPTYMPARSRFAESLPGEAPIPQREPAPDRSTPAVAEVEKSARMALAAVESSQSDDAPPVPLPTNAPLREASLPENSAAADDGMKPAERALAEAIPEVAPLPTRRPEAEGGGIPLKPSVPAPRSSGPMLAYAKPDEPVEREQPKPFNKFALPGAGSGVAVYDIKAATVYLPDGERLEAHSGLGRFTDNPAFVDRKNVGPTPPNTYKLTLRKERFHGVEAIRMTPVTDQKMYGRDGFLLHTYMLRGRYAQSNGCVVFKNYEKFLRAFKRGGVTKLVVVPTLSGHPVVASQHRWNLFHIGEDNRGA